MFIMEKRFFVLIFVLIFIFVIGIFYIANPSKLLEKIFNIKPNSDTLINYSSEPIPVPGTRASAITSPPPSMDGINTHTELYGTGADPKVITLGPKRGAHPDYPTYSGKC